MESSTAKGFFCVSLGATLDFLSFFTLNKARILLKSLCSYTANYYDKQENNIFRMCLPTVFSSTISHYKSIRGGENKFIIKVLHLRDNLFLIAYATNEIVIQDIQTLEVIDRIEIENDEPLIDFDFYGDEKCILVGFRTDICVLVNMKQKSKNQFPHYLPQPLCLVQFLKHFHSKNFFTISKGGVFRVWDIGLQCYEIAKFHPSQFITDHHRPFSFLIEFTNDDQNSLQYVDGVQQTAVAFILQGKAMKNAVVIYRYFGYNNPLNKLQSIPIDGQLIHCLKQIQTKYLAISLDKVLQIHDIISGNVIRTIDTQQPFQFLIRVNDVRQKFEFGLIGEACIGYSYKSFFECGISIAPGEQMQDFQFQVLKELEEKRRRQALKIKEKPNAIISFCQFETGKQNFLIVTPREEQDSIIIFKVNLQ